MNAAARIASAGLEVRAAAELRVSTGRRLVGYAAVFSVPAEIGGRFTETLLPGCFRKSLAEKPDILALVDHDPGQVLARTKSGTLLLAEDPRGLAFELSVPDTSLGRDILALTERGDLGGMSFGFKVRKELWPAKNRRELQDVDLIEISAIHAFPAYPETVVSARSRHAAEARRRRRIAWGLL